MSQKPITCPICNRVNSAQNVVCSKCGFDLQTYIQSERTNSSTGVVSINNVENSTKQEDAQSIAETARKMHAVYLDEARRYVAAQRGWKRMWIGFFWLALGSCITWGTYSAAASSPYGGSYTICYGAIGLGFIYFLLGLFEWLENL